ncbi:MAG: hypothetical protein KA004_07760 [Verrucomicrobiales bacterium]|nr:hypothetical protein [Verrucomicrobiales bacterium]
MTAKLFAAVWLAAALAAAADSQELPNQAARSPLPQGAGFAAAFKADAGIAKSPEVVFADDFEGATLGAGWDETSNPNGNVLSLTEAGAPQLGKQCVRVDAHLGKDTGGGFTKWFAPHNTIFIRFYTKFHPACDYVHHFVTLRANRGLRGGDKWSGFGGAGNKPAGDERFSTAIEAWGNWGKFPPPGRWNFYSYWHEMKKSPDGKYWGNAFSVPEAPVIKRGEWICVEFMLKHNTPGKPDGEQAFWIDGQRLGHWTGINWRKTEGLKANALTLESYVTDRWTKNPVNTVYYDNLVIAGKYIGPSGK